MLRPGHGFMSALYMYVECSALRPGHGFTPALYMYVDQH